ncbi:hypothetical protein BJX76DRAFT_338108 [Aspergillus varians]
MPVQRRLRRSPLECAQCTEGQMECSKARPQCDECKSQRVSCRYRDQSSKQSQRQSIPRPRKPATRKTHASFTSDSSPSSSPSPPSTAHRKSTASSTSSAIESNLSEVKDDERAKTPESCHAVDELSPRDQRLLAKWSSSTERSLTHSKSKDRSWQSIIRRDSVRYPALRHSTLALSAIHLASTSETGTAKRKDHLTDAARHYSQAVDAFPPLHEDPSESRCNAAFSTASLLFMCELTSPSLVEDGFSLSHSLSGSRSFASSPSPCAPVEPDAHEPSVSPPSLQKIVDLFATVRDLSSGSDILDVVEKGELSALFTQSDPYHQLPSTYTLTILTMRNLNTATAQNDPSHATSVYDDTIAKLDRSLEMLSKGGEPTMIALRWMFRIPSRYLDLVREKQPLALIIFAHYCAVLHHLRDRWWMGNWGSRLVKEISQLLGPERLGSILWASDIVGIQT